MRNFSLKLNLLAILLFISFFVLFTPHNQCYSQTNLATNEVIKSLIKDYIKSGITPGVKVIGVGSWITNNNYRDPINLQPGKFPSDHDFRLVMPDGMSNEQAIAEWKKAQEWFSREIRSRYGDDIAKKVLKSVNLYPPQQLVRGIENNSQAIKVFKELGSNPNLGGEALEGLFSEDSLAAKQFMESKKGTLFAQNLSNKNDVYTTLADLEHLAEGRGNFTLDGMSKVADDWIDHAHDALAKGDIDSTRKYLERLEDTLKKGKSLGRAKHESYLNSLIDQLKKLKAGDTMSSELSASIRKAIKQAQTESTLLSKLAKTTNAREIELIYQLLEERSSKWSRLKGLLSEMGDAIPVDKVISGIFLAFDGYQALDLYKSGDPEGAYRKAFEGIIGAATLGPGLMAVLTNAIIDDAKENGYIFVTNPQDCEDLLIGICEATGRGSVIDKPKYETTMDQILTEFQPTNSKEFESAIGSRLQTMAHQCAVRGHGEFTNEKDRAAEMALYDRCIKDLTKKWNIRRMNIMGDIAQKENAIVDAINKANIYIDYSPTPAKLDKNDKTGEIALSLKANFSSSLSDISDNFNKMSEEIRKLGGKSHLAYIRVERFYTWFVDGKEVQKKQSYYNGGVASFFEPENAALDYTFKGPQTYDVTFKFEAKITYVSGILPVDDDVVSKASKMFNLDQVISRQGGADITILKDEAESKVKIIKPEKVIKGEKFKLKAELSEDLKNRKDVYINWYTSPKGNSPFGYGIEIEIFPPGDKSEETYIVEVTNGEVGGFSSITNTLSDIFGKTKTVISVLAQDSSKINIEIKSFDDDIETAFKEKNWKKLFDLFERTEKQNEKDKIKNYIKQLADIFLNDLKQKNDVLTQFKTKNDAAYQAFKTKIKSEMEKLYASAEAAKNNKDSAGYARYIEEARKKGDCNAVTIERYELENGKLITSLQEIKYILDYSKNTDGRGLVNYSFFQDYGKLNLKIKYDLSKSIPEVDYNGFCANEKSVKGLKEFKLKLKASKINPQVGEEVEIIAEIVDGTGNTGAKYDEYGNYVRYGSGRVSVVDLEGELEDRAKYVWTGENIATYGSLDGTSSSSVTFLSSKTGSFNVSVSRKDEPSLGSDTITINVGGSDLSATITGIEDKVPYGSERELTLKLNSGLANAELDTKYSFESKYNILWNSSPNLTFNPQESSNGKTKVSIDRMQNPTKIWAEIRENKNGVLKTVATSEQLDITVISPKFSFKYEPTPDLVKLGKPVKVKIESDTFIPYNIIDYRWVEPTERKEVEANEIEFIPKDKKPVKIHVIARVPKIGDTVDENIKDEFIPGEHKVIAKVLGPKYDTPVYAWNEKKGLSEVTKEFTVGQDILVTSSIEGSEVSSTKYEWSSNSGCTIAAGQYSQIATVNRNEVGTCELTVTVKDKDNTILGKGTISFDITVSQDRLNKGKPKPSDEEIIKIIEKAKQLVSDGKLDEGINLIDEALKINAGNEKLDTYLKKLNSEKDAVNKTISLAKASADQGKFDVAKNQLNEAVSIHPNYKPVVDAVKYISEQEQKQGEKILLDNSKNLYQQDKIDEAFELLDGGVKKYPSNKEIAVEFAKVKTEKDSITSKISNINNLIENEKLNDAQAAFNILKPTHPAYKPILNLENILKVGREKLAQKKITEAQSQVSLGLLDDAINSLSASKNEFPENKTIDDLLSKLNTERDFIKLHYTAFNKSVAYAKYEEGEAELNALNSSPHSKYKDIIAANNIWGSRSNDRKNLAKMKLEEGENLVSQGLLSEGMTKAEEGFKYDKNNSTISQFLSRIKSEKATCDQQVSKVQTLINQKQLDQAQIELNKASNLHRMYKPVRDAQALLETAKQQKNTNQQLVEGKIQQAKWRAENEGKMDEAIAFIDEALVLDPINQTAIELGNQLRKAKTSMLEQVEKIKVFVAQGNLDQAKNELILAKSFYPKYQPVVDAENLINGKIASTSKEVDQKIIEAQSALGNNYFTKTLDSIKQIRQNYRLDQNQQITLNNMEAIAQKALNSKQQALYILKIGENAYNQKDYQNALSNFEQGLGSFGNPWEPTDKEPGYYWNLKSDSMQKLTRINQLLNLIYPVANNNGYSKTDIEMALKNAYEILTIQPQNIQGLSYKQVLEQKLASMNNFQNTRPNNITNNNPPLNNNQNSNFTNQSGNYSNQNPNYNNQQNNQQSGTNQNTLVKGLIEQCNNFYDQGRYQEALQKCKELDIVYPNPFTKKRITEISTKLTTASSTKTSSSGSKISSISSNNTKTASNSAGGKKTNTVSTSNSGYNTTTEICKWTGNWQTTKGNLAFSQYGNKVSGTYDQNGGRIEGIASGRMFSGYWSQMPSYQPPYDYGKVKLTISSDCKSFTGEFHSDSDHINKTWNGTKVIDTSANTSSTKIINTKPVSSGFNNNIKQGGIKTNNNLPTVSSGCYDGEYAGNVTMDNLSGNITAIVSGSNVTGKVTGGYYSEDFQSDWSGTVNIQNGQVTGKVSKGHLSCIFKELDYTADFFGSIQGNSASGTVNGYSYRGNRTAKWTINRLSSTGNCNPNSANNIPNTPKTETKIFDNGNTGGCGYTDTSRFSLRQPSVINKLEIWFSWEGAQTNMPYTLSSQSGIIKSGNFSRAGCDTYQKQWCQGLDNMNLTLPTGNYILKTAKPRICQNSGSGGNGMIKVYSDPVATANVNKNPSLINQPVKQPDIGVKSQNSKTNNVNQIIKTPSNVIYDGTYSGSIVNQDGDIGNIRFTVSGNNVSGTAGGIFEGDDFTVHWSGTVNQQSGYINGNISKGVLTTKQYKQDYPFSGNINGNISGNAASGNWSASNNWGTGSGSWKASKIGNSGGNSINSTPVKTNNTIINNNFSVGIRIFNISSNNIHLFPDGETFGPSNRTAPGSSRTFTLNFSPGKTYKIYAGRNGQVLTSITLDYNSMKGYTAAHYTFNDAQELLIKEKFK